MKILVAIDYSRSTPVIVKKAKELAEAFSAEVILLHVLSDITYYSSLNYSPITGFDSFSTMDIVQTSTREDLKEATNKYLEKVADNFKDVKVKTVIREGDFADEILKGCEEAKAKIVVMGTHSRSGFDKIFMGSVAESVLHKSEIPVYIVPIRDRAE